jgi:hypothetical protein
MPPGTISLISVPEFEELPSVSLRPMRAARSRTPGSPKCPSFPLSAITESKSRKEIPRDQKKLWTIFYRIPGQVIFAICRNVVERSVIVYETENSKACCPGERDD